MAVIAPAPRAQVFMDPDAAGLGGPGREVRKDDGDVADLSHDGIGLVGLALLEAAGMNMDVGNDLAASVPTMGPEVAEPAPVDLNDAGLQGVRLSISAEN